MKETFLPIALRNAAKRIPLGLGIALAATLLHLNATAQEVNLGTANSFSVLSYSGISVTGAVNSSTIYGGAENNGNIGSFPTASTGLGNLLINNGSDQAGDALTQSAQAALTSAYNQAAGITHTPDLNTLVLGSGGTIGSCNEPSDSWGLLLFCLSTDNRNPLSQRQFRKRSTLRFPNRINPHNGIV